MSKIQILKFTMTTSITDVITFPPFDVNETTNISSRWKRWLRDFGLYAEGKSITDASQRLHTAGMAVQDIFFTLKEVREDEDNAFVKMKKTLEKHFTPQSNVPYERHVFRNTAQLPSETVEQFITRLRIKAETCELGLTVEEQIRDQVIDKCLSHHLRRKLLEKARTLKFNISIFWLWGCKN